MSKSNVAVVIGVNFSGATSTKSVTITDLSIMANAEIYKLITGGGLVPIQVSVSKGKAVMSFTSDPDFVVQNVTGVYAKDLLTGKNTTYLPIWYVMQVVHKVSIGSAWNGTTWSLTEPAAQNGNSGTTK